MELKITDDKVREAAASCPDAKKVLKKLFPEVFSEVNTKTFSITSIKPGFKWAVVDEHDIIIICPRDDGRNIWINGNYYKFSLVDQFTLSIQKK